MVMIQIKIQNFYKKKIKIGQNHDTLPKMHNSNNNLGNTDPHPAKEREPKEELEPPATSAMQMVACRRLFVRRKMHFFVECCLQALLVMGAPFCNMIWNNLHEKGNLTKKIHYMSI